MKKITVTLLVVLVMLLAWTGITFAQAPDSTQLEQEMLDLVNRERVKLGLSPLKMDEKLVTLARLKSQDMIDRNYFSHTSPTYGDPFEMMKTYGVEYLQAGENLAGNPSLSGAHQTLMDSPGHRANILKPEFTHVGIGVVKGGPYGMMVTQMFIKTRTQENKKQENKELKIFHGDREIQFPDIAPYINSDQRIMVPLRAISQEMGYQVEWDIKEQKITLKNGPNTMDLWVGKKQVRRNQQIIMGDTVPEVCKGRALVPVRLVSELLGCKITWYPALNKAVIN